MEKQISIKILESKHTALKALAKKRGMVMFILIDRALARYLAESKKP